MYSQGLRDSSHFTTEKISMHKSWKQKGILLRTHWPACVPYTCTCVREYGWLRISLHREAITVHTCEHTGPLSLCAHTLWDMFYVYEGQTFSPIWVRLWDGMALLCNEVPLNC